MIQRQPFRYTDCRCMFETPMDIVAMIIFLIFAAAGFFWFLEATFKATQRWANSDNYIKRFIVKLFKFIEDL